MSLKGHKKSRNKNRATPYTRPVLPTPSSPSEAEYEPILKDSPIFSEKQLEFANPTELSVRDDTPQRESTGFSVNDGVPPRESTGFFVNEVTPHRESTGFSANDVVVPHRESTGFSTSDVIVPHRESTGFSTSEIIPQRESTGFSMIEEIMPTEGTEKEDTPTQENVDCLSKTQVVDSVTPMELTPREEEEHDIQEDRPLQYGDLVVVDYAEKKKVHKWPAIVLPFPCLIDIRLCPLDI